MSFASVIRELQLHYHAAARAEDPCEAREHRESAAALADAHEIPAEITDALCAMAHEHDGPDPLLYTSPDDAGQDAAHG